MYTSLGRTCLSQTQYSYGHVPFSTSASCYETHNTGENQAKYYSIGELWCHAAILAAVEVKDGETSIKYL